MNVQNPESIHSILYGPGIICSTICRTLAALASFAVKFGDPLRLRDHLREARQGLHRTAVFGSILKPSNLGLAERLGGILHH